MKLATLKNNTRDGNPVLVTRDLTRFVQFPDGISTMQEALDNWKEIVGRLQELSDELEGGSLEGEAFNPALCHSPLPRAYQWADGFTAVYLQRKLCK